MPYLVLGLALVVAGALGAVWLTSRAGQRVEALMLVRDIPVGQAVTAGDLRAEAVLAGSTVAMIPVAQAGSVVGRVAAVPLKTGHLLAPDDIGGLAWPPAGQVLLAVAVAPGSYPPELAPGMHVLVTAAPADSGAAATGSATAAVGSDVDGAAEAVVAGVRANPNGSAGAVVSLLLSRASAALATGIPASRLRLIVVPAPGPTASGSPGAAAAPGGGG